MLLTILGAAVGVALCGPAGTEANQAMTSSDLQGRVTVEPSPVVRLRGDEDSKVGTTRPDLQSHVAVNPAGSVRLAAADDPYNPDEDIFNCDSGGSGGGGPCTITDCITTCIPGYGPECSCWYQCPSGGTWVVKPGYCPNTYTSCLP